MSVVCQVQILLHGDVCPADSVVRISVLVAHERGVAVAVLKHCPSWKVAIFEFATRRAMNVCQRGVPSGDINMRRRLSNFIFPNRNRRARVTRVCTHYDIYLEDIVLSLASRTYSQI